jgi:hypothetical protein
MAPSSHPPRAVPGVPPARIIPAIPLKLTKNRNVKLAEPDYKAADPVAPQKSDISVSATSRDSDNHPTSPLAETPLTPQSMASTQEWIEKDSMTPVDSLMKGASGSLSHRASCVSRFTFSPTDLTYPEANSAVKPVVFAESSADSVSVTLPHRETAPSSRNDVVESGSQMSPEFIHSSHPVEQLHTPFSASSSSAPTVEVARNGNMPQHRSNGSKVVFGSFSDSPGSSPPPSNSYSTPPQQAAGPGSSAGYSSYAHGNVEPVTGFTFPQAVFGYGQGYAAPPPFNGPPQWFSPATSFQPSGIQHPFVPNGHVLSRSTSGSSSGPPEVYNPRSAFKQGGSDKTSHNTSPSGSAAPFPIEALMMRDYVSSQFGNPEFADYVVNTKQFRTEGLESSPGWLVHGLVIARSPTLKALIGAQRAEQNRTVDGLRILEIRLCDDFITSGGIMQSIAYLYGLPLTAFEDIRGTPSRPESDPHSAQSMHEAIGHSAAGDYLQVPAVMVHGMTRVKNLLRWDNLEEVVRFFVLGGFAPSDSDHREERRGAVWPVYGESKHQFLQMIVQFVVFNFPKDFSLHQSASELASVPRLPMVQGRKPSTSDPRLSRIQFGDVPLEADASLEISTKLSSVLLSLPLYVLQAIFEAYFLGGKLGWSKVGAIMRDVVEERERRRLQVFKLGTRILETPSLEQWEQTKWEERAEQSDKTSSGYVFVREPKPELAEKWAKMNPGFF